MIDKISALAAERDMQITDLSMPGVDPEIDGFGLAYVYGDEEPHEEMDPLPVAEICVAIADYVAHIEVPGLTGPYSDMVITHYRDARPSLLAWDFEEINDGAESNHMYRCTLHREVSDEPMLSFVLDLTNRWSIASLNRS